MEYVYSLKSVSSQIGFARLSLRNGFRCNGQEVHRKFHRFLHNVRMMNTRIHSIKLGFSFYRLNEFEHFSLCSVLILVMSKFAPKSPMDVLISHSVLSRLKIGCVVYVDFYRCAVPKIFERKYSIICCDRGDSSSSLFCPLNDEE